MFYNTLGREVQLRCTDKEIIEKIYFFLHNKPINSKFIYNLSDIEINMVKGH